MKFFDRLFNRKPKNYAQNADIQFGSINTATGEISDGYIDKDGGMKFRPTGKCADLWDEPIYLHTVTEWRTTSSLFGKKNRNEWDRPFYKQTNRYSGEVRYYFVNIDGYRVYMLREAYERDGKLVRI